MLKRTAMILSMAFVSVFASIAQAQSQQSSTYMCVFPQGESRLVSPAAPRMLWEVCARELPVIAEGLTTTKLTFALSAAYDIQTRRFSNVGAGSTSEFIRPGEHLLVFDARLNGRNLSYSLSTNSYRFVNIDDIETKLIASGTLQALKVNSGAQQLFMTVEAAPFSGTTDFTVAPEIGGGRIFAGRGSTFDDQGEELIFVECLSARCNGARGWIPAMKLSELALMDRPTGVFPSTYQYLSLDLIKRCNVASKFTSAAELKAAIAAKVPFAPLVGAELNASIEAVVKNVREDSYDADVKVERTIFTVFKFRAPRWWERNRWYPDRVRVLIVDRVTVGCNSNAPREYFELRTDNGSFEITEAQAIADITSSVVYTAFVAQAQARSRGRVKLWALNHIASALSALRR